MLEKQTRKKIFIMVKVFCFLVLFFSLSPVEAVLKDNPVDQSAVISGDLFVDTLNVAELNGVETVEARLTGDGSQLSGLTNAVSGGWELSSPNYINLRDTSDFVKIGDPFVSGKLSVLGSVHLRRATDSLNKLNPAILEVRGNNPSPSTPISYLGVDENNGIASFTGSGLNNATISASGSMNYILNNNLVSGLSEKGRLSYRFDRDRLTYGLGRANQLRINETSSSPNFIHDLVVNGNVKARRFIGNANGLTNLPSQVAPSNNSSCEIKSPGRLGTNGPVVNGCSAQTTIMSCFNDSGLMYDCDGNLEPGSQRCCKGI